MRRKDRELTVKEDLLPIMQQCKVCRIAMIDHDQPYIVPMNFGYEFQDETLYLYFHCATEGRKIDILRIKNQVCFEMDCAHKLVEGNIACQYGYSYASIIGDGVAEFIEDSDCKAHALLEIMRHQTGRSDFKLDDKMMDGVTVFQIVSTQYNGKKRQA